ncbi:L-threonine dehydratase catabolic TdcB-like [Pectinophora gossypiella]|uniref:L-threonine dehydratase catabolic TdcB-like n=1 Tax=Pectinophora gossypiella TaxID=13191 RepID=UPI00214E56D4|nr:L-threonine dehydratase catabolic TdcB-like [Pectinophora gossypiella]
MPKPPKAPAEAPRPSMGESPGVLSKRTNSKKSSWCPKVEIEFDPQCDPQNPKAINYKEIIKAAGEIGETIPKTPLVKSRCCNRFGLQLYYKIETLHRTGSFNERGALNALLSLTPAEQDAGVITASLGNFGMALSYHARKMNVRARIIFPEKTPAMYVDKCKQYGAKVYIDGENFMEARHQAFVMAIDLGSVYINGYDNPSVIAGCGTIGLEILEELPEADVIIVPVGGGALIAGIAEATKHIKPDIQIYGVEPDKCCCFFKAMEKDGIFETEVRQSVAGSLAIPTAGCNSFHTAKPYISKMILVDDDWIMRAILHFAEEEKLVAEGAGATSLSALMAMPNILPELKDKVVVCIMSGSNIDNITFPRCLTRAKAVEGSLIKISFKMMVETRDLEHSCQVKRVLNKLFPDKCEFLEDPFSPIPICSCFPKKQGPPAAIDQSKKVVGKK